MHEPFGHGASFSQKEGAAFKKNLVLAHPSRISGVFRCVGSVKGRQQRPFGSTLCARDDSPRSQNARAVDRLSHPVLYFRKRDIHFARDAISGWSSAQGARMPRRYTGCQRN